MLNHGCFDTKPRFSQLHSPEGSSSQEEGLNPTTQPFFPSHRPTVVQNKGSQITLESPNHPTLAHSPIVAQLNSELQPECQTIQPCSSSHQHLEGSSPLPSLQVLDRHGSVSHPLHSLPSQEKQLKPIHKYTWGHTMDEIDSSQIFRVLLQNPNGIRPYEKDLRISLQPQQVCFPQHWSHIYVTFLDPW
jgi:hypothetical protein